MFPRSVRWSLIVVLLLFGMLFVSAAPALAQGSSSHPTATINTGALNVRSGPDYTYARVTTLYQGQQVALLARYSQNQWVKIVTPSGIDGWVNSRYLLTSVPVSSLPVVGPPAGTPPPPSSANATAIVTGGTLNVRTGPGSSYGVTVVLQPGDMVYMLARDAGGQWVLVRTQSGVQGWVAASHLQPSVPISTLPVVSAPTMPPPQATGATGIVATGALNVRQGPGTAYQVITTVAQGQTVYLVGRNNSGSWLLVTAPNGARGWANASYIRTNVNVSALPVSSAPPPTTNSAVVTVGALHVRVAPGPDFPLVGTVLRGAQVGMLGRNSSGTWVLIQTPGGAVGWVNAAYIDPYSPISQLPIAG